MAFLVHFEALAVITIDGKAERKRLLKGLYRHMYVVA